MTRDDCGESDVERRLWGKGCKQETVGKVMRREDCGENVEERGLWDLSFV